MAMFGKIESMNPGDEKLVRVGLCPMCVPAEGRQEKMRQLVDSGSIKSFQCARCQSVWIVETPNNDQAELPPGNGGGSHGKETNDQQA